MGLGRGAKDAQGSGFKSHPCLDMDTPLRLSDRDALTRMKACLPVQDLEGPLLSVRRSGPGLCTWGKSLSLSGPWCPCFYKQGCVGGAGRGPRSGSSRHVSPFPRTVLRGSLLLSLAGLAPGNSVCDSTWKLFTVSRADAVSAGVTTDCGACCVTQHCTPCSMALLRVQRGHRFSHAPVHSWPGTLRGQGEFSHWPPRPAPQAPAPPFPPTSLTWPFSMLLQPHPPLSCPQAHFMHTCPSCCSFPLALCRPSAPNLGPLAFSANLRSWWRCSSCWSACFSPSSDMLRHSLVYLLPPPGT